MAAGDRAVTGAPWTSEISLHGDSGYLNENIMAFHALESCSGTPASVMVDVGAHFGGSLMRYLQADWDIWAFEPDPANRSKLFGRLIDQEHMPRRVDKRAVSEVSGETVDFYVSPVSAAIGTLRPFHATHQAEHQVTTVRLDDFIADYNIENVDYLKIDIEGFDFFALKSFPFDSMTPKAILCQFGDRKTVPLGYSYRDLGVWLQERGYQVLISEWYPIAEYGQVHSWRSISEYQGEQLADDAWGNFLCFKNPLSNAELERCAKGGMQKGSPKADSTAAPAKSQSEEFVELLHDVVTTLARHERSIHILESAGGRDSGVSEAKVNP